MEIWFKAEKDSEFLGNGELFSFYNGTKTGNNSKYIVDEKESDICKPVLRGKDFYRYLLQPHKKFIVFDKENLWSNTNDSHFIVDSKLLIRRTSDHLAVAYDNNQSYVLDTVHLLYSNTENYKNSYLLALLNSKLFHLLYRLIVPEGGKAFAEVKITNLKNLPIKKCEISQQELIGKKALKIQEFNRELYEFSQILLNLLQSKFDIDKLSRKLENWHDLTFKQFLKELKKKKVKLSLSQEAEWMVYFNEQKAKADELKSQIEQTDREIDAMVYELYGLGGEEVKVVEGKY